MVGGAVRNALIGSPIHEIDLATTAVPEEVVRRAQAAGFKPVPTGIEHGTVTVVVDGHPFEVTTLRRDVETYGRHAKVAFGRDWKTDAERRDFTINALSATRDGAVYDYVGGLGDLAARRVRFIGEPRQRIEEDYLRVLRFFRFPRRLRLKRSSRCRRPCRLHRRPRRARSAFPRAGAHGDDEAGGGAARGADAHRHDRRRVAAARARRRELSSELREHGQSRGRDRAQSRSGAQARRACCRGRRGCRAAVAEAAADQQRARAVGVDGGSLARGTGRPTASRRRARCSTGSGREISPIARCSPGRARRQPRTIPAGTRWRACRNAGARRCFR